MNNNKKKLTGKFLIQKKSKLNESFLEYLFYLF
jgi:hypothetical protein